MGEQQQQKQHKQKQQNNQSQMMMRRATKSFENAKNEKEDQVYWDRSVSSEYLWIHETRLGKNRTKQNNNNNVNKNTNIINVESRRGSGLTVNIIIKASTVNVINLYY